MLAHYTLHTLPHNLKGYTINSLFFPMKTIFNTFGR